MERSDEHAERLASTGGRAGGERRPWFLDPIVGLGALVGCGATGYAVFADRYLPYIDWAAHLGLISVLAHGDTTGALEFFERSWAPSPYLLFYAATAILAKVTTVDAAAKIVLVLTAGLLGLGASSLADATGRNPRLGAIGPLALFGISLGWGFGSFVVAVPMLLFALAGNERMLQAIDDEHPPAGEPGGRPRSLWWEATVLATWLGLLFLSHGFLFVTGVLLIGVRNGLRSCVRARAGLRAAIRPVLVLGLALLPSILLALPAATLLLERPSIEEGTPSDTTKLELVPLAQHFESIPSDMLDRGSPLHWNVMYAVVALFLVHLVLSVFRAEKDGEETERPRTGTRRYGLGLEIYASLVAALYLFGPMTIPWPSTIWLVYPRFGVIAALLVLLLPRCDLRGPLGASIALLALGLVGWNASINATHIRNFSMYANAYDPVRAAIPPGSRVLALTVPGPSEPQLAHHSLGSLYAYLMVDGASYVAFLFDKPELPVHRRREVTLRAPFWKSPWSYDPSTHGLDFDYLVLRGESLIQRTQQAGHHELIKNVNGWAIFKTREPRPRAAVSRK